MGGQIVTHGIRPSLIVSSPAVRAWTTARLIATEISYPLEFLQREDGIYLASLDRLLDVVAAQDDGFDNLMLVGHNPGLTELANFLQPGICDNLPTAGVLCVTLDQNDWNLYSQPNTQLVAYDYPKLHQ